MQSWSKHQVRPEHRGLILCVINVFEAGIMAGVITPFSGSRWWWGGRGAAAEWRSLLTGPDLGVINL